MSHKKTPARKKPAGDAFFAANEKEPFEFGGEKVFIHELDSETYIQYCGILSKKPAASLSDVERTVFAKNQDKRARALLIVRCVHNEDGSRRFTDEDIDRVESGMRPHAFVQMSSIAMNMTGLLEGMGAAEKN